MKTKLNSRILNAIQKNCENDEIIRIFLIELLNEEVQHSGSWWAMREYEKTIRELCRKWGSANENK